MCGWKIAAVLGFAGCSPARAATWTGAAADCIKVTPDMAEDWSKHDFHYPSNYADTCEQSGMEPGSFHCTWVNGSKATHEFAIGANYNSNWDSEAWCTDKFCWVDPCTCDKTDIAKSTWVTNGYYSYSMCGATDSYTPATCDGTTETACVAVSGCKWEAAACAAKTGAEAMADLRNASGCANPATAPTGCACSPNTEPKVTCNAANKALWDGTSSGSTTGSTTSDASGVKIGSTMALLLLYLAK